MRTAYCNLQSLYTGFWWRSVYLSCLVHSFHTPYFHLWHWDISYNNVRKTSYTFSFKFSSIIIFFITKNKPDFLYDSFIQKVRLVFLVDLAGIEPASESLFIEASPITVAVLTFPWMYAHRQAYNLSSFMIHLPGQSLPGKVSHMVDVRFLKCECIRADEQQLGC